MVHLATAAALRLQGLADMVLHRSCEVELGLQFGVCARWLLSFYLLWLRLAEEWLFYIFRLGLLAQLGEVELVQ